MSFASSQKRPTGPAPTRRGLPLPLPVLLAIAGSVILIAILGYAIWNTVQARNVRVAPIEGEQLFPPQERGHVEADVQYDIIPPVGGPHNSAWQNCGTYDQPIQNVFAVHSLEHGAVWVTYQPDLPADQVEILRQTASGNSYVLLSPYPGLPAPVVASAWGVQLKLDSAADPRLWQFIQKYQQGAQTPEVGAACTGGVGQPTAR
jgi:hypothetical protein